MTKAQYIELNELLSANKQIVITTHKSPDGDAIGSSLGLYHVLKAKGCNVSVVVPNGYPDFLKWMPSEEVILNYEIQEQEVSEVFQSAEILFCLDYHGAFRGIHHPK